MTGRIITVDFRGDTLFAIERGDGVFLAVKPIVLSLGLDWRAQFRRLTENIILAEGVVITAIPSQGGAQETVCLRLDLVNGWLFGIDARRVKESIRERVLTYQRECYATLFRHFYGAVGQAVAPHQAEAKALRLVAEARHTFGIEAAGQLWFKLHLPVVPAMEEAAAGC